MNPSSESSSPALQKYRELEGKLIAMREAFKGLESPEEEALLDEMSDVWWELTEEECELLRSEGPKTLLVEETLS